MQNFTFTGPYGEIECIVNSCEKANAPVLVMAHGFRGSRDGGGRAIELADKVQQYVNVVRFNFNGSQILSRQIEELQAVVAAVRKQLPDRKIILLGRSLGGAAAMLTAAQDNEIAGLILWATPNNLRQTFQQALGQEQYALLDSGKTLHLADERGKLALTPDFLTDIDKYDIDVVLKNWQQRPVLILHGAADETVDVSQAKRNFSLLNVRKELHIFPEGDHSFTCCSGEAGEIICKWLQQFA